MVDLIQFQLEDERTGLRAIFFTSASYPGDVSVAIWDWGTEAFRVPSEEEVEVIERHPLSNRVRVDLVLESGKKWPVWKPYAQVLLGLIAQRTHGES
jgi:hypothetical protein